MKIEKTELIKDTLKVKKTLLTCNTKEQLILAEKMIGLLEAKYIDVFYLRHNVMMFTAYLGYLVGVYQTTLKLKFNDDGKGE